MTICLKPDFCKKKQRCFRGSATCWAQRVDTQVDWPNIRRSATCWAQRVDTQVDWPNSFWDMTKCLKPDFCKLKKQQCIRRSATCWAQRVERVDTWRNNSVFGAALPAEHNALTLRSIGPIVSEIWRLRYDNMFKTCPLRSIGPIVSEIWQNV